jgi:hypothetical protein
MRKKLDFYYVFLYFVITKQKNKKIKKQNKGGNIMKIYRHKKNFKIDNTNVKITTVKKYKCNYRLVQLNDELFTLNDNSKIYNQLKGKTK